MPLIYHISCLGFAVVAKTNNWANHTKFPEWETTVKLTWNCRVCR